MSADEPEPSFKKQLLAWVGIFGCFILIAALWKLGVFNAASKIVVDRSLNIMQKETEHQTHQSTVVIKKDGERIECKKVNDQGEYWGLVRSDGKFSAVKKADVQEILEGIATSAKFDDVGQKIVDSSITTMMKETELLPAQFASRASTVISDVQARAILTQMGIQVPTQIVDKAALSAALRSLEGLTQEQIGQFVQRAAELSK